MKILYVYYWRFSILLVGLSYHLLWKTRPRPHAIFETGAQQHQSSVPNVSSFVTHELPPYSAAVNNSYSTEYTNQSRPNKIPSDPAFQTDLPPTYEQATAERY